VQSRLYSPGYVGPARWVLFEPRARRAFSALGKDVVPDVISILAEASSGATGDQLLERHPHVTSRHLDSLIDAQVLVDCAPPSSSAPPAFMASFHLANVDYPFFDYGSADVTEHESRLLDHYASLWAPPPSVLSREGPSYALPRSDPDLGQVPDAKYGMTLDALAWLLKIALAPIGEIKTRHVTCVRRTTPSGGARDPTELAVVLGRPLGKVPPGSYTYDIDSHALVAELPSAHDANAATLEPGDIGLVVRTRVERAMWRYRDLRALRPLLIDAGHVTELVAYLLGRLGLPSDVISPPVAVARPSWLHEPEVAMIRVRRLGTEIRPLSRPRTSENADGGYLANPAMVLRFTPVMSANVIWPVAASIPIDLADFLILNHCLPSTRGDRDQSESGIVQAVPGSGTAAIKRLADLGALLPANEALAMYDDLRLWVRHEWYLSLLAYLEALQHGVETPAASHVAPDTGYLADIAALLRRRTSRAFSPEPVAIEQVKGLLARVFPAGRQPDAEVSLASWNVEGLDAGLYRWRDGSLVYLSEVPDRELVAENCAGQTAPSSGALALWVSLLTDPGRPERYLLDLVDLGRVGQRVCAAATELGIAVFVSPAVYDRPTCSMLGIDKPDQRFTYVFGLGSPISPQTASTRSSVAE
jgi:hypothetical protein